jgi:hypothetical protein
MIIQRTEFVQVVSCEHMQIELDEMVCEFKPLLDGTIINYYNEWKYGILLPLNYILMCYDTFIKVTYNLPSLDLIFTFNETQCNSIIISPLLVPFLKKICGFTKKKTLLAYVTIEMKHISYSETFVTPVQVTPTSCSLGKAFKTNFNSNSLLCYFTITN